MKTDSVAFNHQKFTSLLATQEFGRPLYAFASLASTNTTLWQLIDQGAAPGTAVIAAQQEAGRGQWGRQWLSPLGGLYLSVAIAPNIPAEICAQLTLCSAWGIASQLRDLGVLVALKWPNDLLLDDRKLGGILTETRLQQNRISKAVIGVGLNWSNPVPKTGINLQTALSSQPQPQSSLQSLERLAAVVLQGLESGYYYWQTYGMASLLPRYVELLQFLGQTVAYQGQTGKATAITPQGNLQIQLDQATTSTAAVTEISVSSSCEITMLKTRSGALTPEQNFS